MKSVIDLWMTRLSYFYLVLPFFLFTAFWLNLYAALSGSLIILASFIFAVRLIEARQFIEIRRSTVFWTLLIMAVVVFYSGVGSYTYQNDDHLYRNAIFRDLVLKDWPVLYKIEGFEGHPLNGKTTMMTYYIGFFLPAALVGKLFGFEAGRFFLYFWTVLGILLVLFQTARYLNRFSFKVVLIFFAWGTLFFVGSLIKYPLEKFGEEGYYLWTGVRLYANSNIGSLYWIFNQAITGWLIMLLILNKADRKNMFFLYSLCLFLSPFCFAGFLPFILYFVITDLVKGGGLKDLVSKYLSFQNIIGALTIVVISYLYLSNNPSGRTFRYYPFESFKVMAAFMVLSWGIIAVILFPKFYKEPLYWLSILILVPLPFFQQGPGPDFPARISMPAFFILMLFAMKLVLFKKNSISRLLMIGYLLVAGVAHFTFEVGRSVYETTYANLSYRTNLDQVLMNSDKEEFRKIGEDLKSIKHEDVLTKDYGTLSNPENPIISNYMSDTEISLFYKYLAKKEKNR